MSQAMMLAPDGAMPLEPAAGFMADHERGRPEGDGEMLRENPDPAPARAELAKRWQKTVQGDKKHWAKQHKQMREDAAFVRRGAENAWAEAQRYVANVVLRHVATKVAALYARNPSVKVKRRERLMSSAWNGSIEQLQMAAMNPMDPNSFAIMMDAQRIAQRGEMMNALVRTVELVLEHQISQTKPRFKQMMKHVVRRAVVQGVGYVKLGYTREGTFQPDVGAMERNAEFSSVHATIDRISAEMTDKRVKMEDADAERLRLAMAGATEQEFVVASEGLAFDFPSGTAIIPDRRMTSLTGFQGCDHVTEEFLLTPEKVKAYFGVDPSALGACTRYRATGEEAIVSSNPDENDRLCVWCTYCKTDGLVYWSLEGWNDFLMEPAPPQIRLERFWPWFSLVLNETEDAENPFPPSDTSILRHAQNEYNRSRDGIRQHRIANRPGHVIRDNGLDDSDVAAITSRGEHDVIRLKGLGSNEKVDDALQPIKGAPIDPALYDTSAILDDILRQSGAQEANLGGTSNGTATEASIAENSRLSSMESNKDDLDELLNEMFAEAGQMLLREMGRDTVVRIAGEGAVWPDLSAEDVADEVYAVVLAGSSGKPNKQVELQNAERMMPILIQVPGISPMWLAKQLIRRMDDDADLTEAIAEGIPSIQAMGAMAKGGGGAGPEQVGDGKNPPSAQGGEGAANAPAPGRAGGRQPPAPQGVGSGAQPMNGAPGGL